MCARGVYSIGKTAQVTSEMQRYRISILGVSECRWSGFGMPRIQTAENILYSGREDDVHQSGVAIVMTRYASRCLESWSSARGGSTPYNGLYGEAPPERGTFFRLQVYKRVGISQVEVYKRVGKSVI